MQGLLIKNLEEAFGSKNHLIALGILGAFDINFNFLMNKNSEEKKKYLT